ncbi:MAG: Hsp20/alpha crystallin family protein [Syntrophales bacterium]|nr:Hsp20/alpha crystallin family protein [Syntrophales bacterium]
MTEKVHYVIRKKEAFCLFYNSKKGPAKSRIWFVTSDLDDWKTKIHQACILKVDVATVEKIAGGLDHDGQDILWYLWDKSHARIDQLAELINASNHMHVLMNIRETINPVAEKIIGCPILSFERSKVDPETGKAVLFSWWLMGNHDKWTQSDERLLDIFDEDSCIQVVMEVKGIEVSDLRLDVERDQIAVRSVKTGSTWKEIINLPAEIDPDSHEMHLKNNLLEIKLSKRTQ